MANNPSAELRRPIHATFLELASLLSTGASADQVQPRVSQLELAYKSVCEDEAQGRLPADATTFTMFLISKLLGDEKIGQLGITPNLDVRS